MIIFVFMDQLVSRTETTILVIARKPLMVWTSSAASTANTSPRRFAHLITSPVPGRTSLLSASIMGRARSSSTRTKSKSKRNAHFTSRQAFLISFFRRHYGCECTAGYTGDHCEARTETTDEAVQDSNTSSEGSSGAPTVAIVFIVFAVVMSTVTAALFYRRFRFWKEKPEAPVEGPQFGHKAEPVLDMGPPHDLDGNDLENVEII
jgi:hypothetical protein